MESAAAGRKPTGRILALLAAAALGLAGYSAARALEGPGEALLRSREIIQEIAVAQAALETAVSSSRGFALSVDPGLLAPPAGSRAAVERRLRRLQALTNGDSAARHRVDRLVVLIAREFDGIEAMIAARRSGGLAAAQARVAEDPGLIIHQGVRDRLQALAEREQRQLEQAALRAREAHYGIALLVGASLAVLAGLAATLAGLTRRERLQHRRIDAERSRLTAILNATPDFVAMAEGAGRLVYLNPAGRRMMGWPEHLAGPATLGSCHPDWARRRLESTGLPAAARDGIWQGESAILRVDGSEVPAWQVLVSHREADGTQVFLSTVMRDLSESQRAKSALQKETERLAAVVGIQQVVGTADLGLTGTTRLIVDCAQALFKADGAAVAMIEGDEVCIRVGSGIAAVHEDRRMAMPGSLVGYCYRTGRALRSDDLANDARANPQARRLFEAGSVMVVPLRGDEDITGVLMVMSARTNGFTEGDTQTLQLVAGLLSAALNRATGVEARLAALSALEESQRAAEIASRTKSQFLANMSHELRTPLNSVIGFANILLRNRDGHLGETELRYISRIAQNGRHLLGLINNVLDLSKIEAGGQEVQRGQVWLADLVGETLGQLEPETGGRNLRLVSEVPEDLEPLETDEGRLRQVLLNLVGNALKFTEEGTIRVRVHLREGTRRPMRLDVSDTGIGIPEDRQQAIFEPFQQADNSIGRRYGGTGLGLTISRSLLELLGYRLRLTSRPGAGATFTIVFEEEPSAQGHPEVASTPGEGEGVLVHG